VDELIDMLSVISLCETSPMYWHTNRLITITFF